MEKQNVAERSQEIPPTQPEPRAPEAAQAGDAPSIPAEGPKTRHTVTREEAIIELARRGHRVMLAELEEIFNANPSLWQNAGDLTRMTEQMWLERICGTNLFNGQAMRRHVEAMKRDLAGPSPTPLEKLLAERIAACWLASQHADLAAATGVDTDGAKVTLVKLQQMESANRRLLATMKSLAVVRRLTEGLKIEISHTHASPATDPDGGADTFPMAEGFVADRLRGLVREGAALEKT